VGDGYPKLLWVRTLPTYAHTVSPTIPTIPTYGGEGSPNLRPHHFRYPRLLCVRAIPTYAPSPTIPSYPNLRWVRAIPTYVPLCSPCCPPLSQPMGVLAIPTGPRLSPYYPLLSTPTVDEGYPNLRPDRAPTIPSYPNLWLV
jgi:hypothetical protein